MLLIPKFNEPGAIAHSHNSKRAATNDIDEKLWSFFYI